MEQKQDLTILWLDDRRRDPVNFLAKANKELAKRKAGKASKLSGAAERTINFYNREIYPKYNVTFDVATNYWEFVDYLQTHGVPEFVSFDRDLGDHMPAGMTHKDYDKNKHDGVACARYLKQYCQEHGQPLPKCFAHTANVAHIPVLEYVLGDVCGKEAVINVGDTLKNYNNGLADVERMKAAEQGLQENRRRTKVTLSESQIMQLVYNISKRILKEGKKRK